MGLDKSPANCLRAGVNSMLTVEEFRGLLKDAQPLDIVDNVLLQEPAVHLHPERAQLVASALAIAYGIDFGEVNIIPTGSAHLGFSLVEKNEPVLPRYRPYGVDSDIDVAVICIPIFGRIWQELTAYYARGPRFPPDGGRLADYVLCGWLRPDHFPKGVWLPRCEKWWDTFNKLSRNVAFQPRRVRGGLFNSVFHLRHYLSRAVRECIRQEETT
jgi:hypothetical protein